MKHVHYLLFILLLIAVCPRPGIGSPARPVLELMEQLARTAGRPAAKGATEALSAAVAREGHAAMDAARRGGLGLTEAAARYGDDVFEIAIRVPEAAPVIAARAETLLPLARKHGDEVLRLEARVPGLGDDAIHCFPSENELRRLVALHPDEARQVVSYASHATDTGAPGLLLRSVETKGSKVLQALDAKKILALGLSSAMVISASGGAISAAAAPDELFGALRFLGFPISTAMALIVLGVGGVLIISLAHRWKLRRGMFSHDHRNEQ